ncbi:Zn(II)2Cys6 transcription factor domain-containing protein [Aspergillus saccharolyticus JOP 1030-1]|uniref:Zn(2)-C6 fungal-type domain-containing protein n=1 Tax=Aspergillus saccharolyticus JOP 1030-1 TaxID=1450539 RepID=A0A318ZFD3_9EURO|nr:hypothetical protein BP01DRAFT_339886 [Aspergillus saccharolyticus JOP 1030-1]PYH45795.1 hypothetical protein BP01DRAFT_339886 [Aspergillus saccharolyticus JOP 1030-1]
MSHQPRLRPKSYIPGYPDAMYNLVAVTSLSQLESRAGPADEKPDQRVFRVKRKHVLKACDRCRVKKTKCDGKQPCNRCSAYNHPCLFRERKATQTKVYSRGFVEMLESHHSLVVKALQRLYKLSVNKEGFPGEPLQDATDGYPLTHAILDRLGLIKQAEENADEPEEESEDLQYLRFLSTSTDSCATTDPSPEPATPPEPLHSESSPVLSSPKCSEPWRCDVQPVATTHSVHYQTYQQHPGYSTMTVPRTDLDSAGFASEMKSANMGQPMAVHEQPCYYYIDTDCGGETTKSHGLPVGLVPQQPVTGPGVPVTLMSDYALHIPEQHAIYPPLAAGWSYHCG